MNTKLPEGWDEVELGEVLDYEQPTKYIVKSTKYDDKFKTPVLTAGKSFLKGYTNETEGIYDDLPVIIFDDFTTASQFVTFPFKVKSSAMKILTTKRKDVSLKYIFYLMQTIKFDSKTHKRYYLSKYQNLNIPLPPIETQEAIVSLLEKAEKAKELRDEADELSKDYLKSVFVDMFGKGKFEIKNLGDICNVQSGGTPSKKINKYWENGTIPWLGSTVCKDIYVNKSKQFITEEGLENSSARFFKKETVLIALVGATIGKTAYLNFKATTNQNIAGIYPKEGVDINSKYLFYAMQTLYYKFISLGKGTFKMANLTFIKNLKIPLPPIELQNKFAEIVKQVESMKEHQKESKEQIDNLFNALMQKAFKGELKC